MNNAKSTVIIDYGMGNLRSVYNACSIFSEHVIVSKNKNDLINAERLILPGVGAFPDGVLNLENNGLIDVLNSEVIDKGKPILGICLGMQLFAESGTENSNQSGLGWISGSVIKLESNAKIRLPHIGWNDVSVMKDSRLYEGLESGNDFYFVHSYALVPEDEKVISGVSDYGFNFVASVETSNIFGTQYHPEKSQGPGLKVLENFYNCND
jgi:imidazole glycerol-phosphate synthase subunit HisH